MASRAEQRLVREMEALQRQLRAVKKRVAVVKAARTGRETSRARIPDHARREVAERVGGGETQASVAKGMGISRRMVGVILKESGREPRRAHQRTQEEEERILELYASGIGAREVAEITGLQETTITKFLRRKGVLRPARHGPRTRQMVADVLRQTGSVQEAARAGGVDGETVRLWAERAGLEHLISPKRPFRATDEEKRLLMISLREQGFSYGQIAQRVGLSAAPVARFLRSVGLGGRRGGIAARRNPNSSARQADLRRIMRL